MTHMSKKWGHRRRWSRISYIWNNILKLPWCITANGPWKVSWKWELRDELYLGAKQVLKSIHIRNLPTSWKICITYTSKITILTFLFSYSGTEIKLQIVVKHVDCIFQRWSHIVHHPTWLLIFTIPLWQDGPHFHSPWIRICDSH